MEAEKRDPGNECVKISANGALETVEPLMSHYVLLSQSKVLSPGVFARTPNTCTELHKKCLTVEVRRNNCKLIILELVLNWL